MYTVYVLIITNYYVLNVSTSKHIHCQTVNGFYITGRHPINSCAYQKIINYIGISERNHIHVCSSRYFLKIFPINILGNTQWFSFTSTCATQFTVVRIKNLICPTIYYKCLYPICDRPQENRPSSHMVMVVEIPVLKKFNWCNQLLLMLG